tara:strand:- start:410 stop:1012 length:603 start_codon:yes stop_codon:yes gene_type:complete
MSKEYGYIGKEVTQAFRDNKGIFTPQDIIELDQENKWTNFGQLELIQTQTISSTTASMDFTNLGNYNVHFITYNDFQGSSNASLTLLFSNDGGSSFITSGYAIGFQLGQITGAFSQSKATSFSDIRLTSGTANENGYCYMYNLLDSTKYSFTTSHAMGNTDMKFGSALKPTAETHNAIRLIPAGVNIETLQASLYGIRFA